MTARISVHCINWGKPVAPKAMVMRVREDPDDSWATLGYYDTWHEALTAANTIARRIRFRDLHNHGPNEGPGLDCPERRWGDILLGACIQTNPRKEQA